MTTEKPDTIDAECDTEFSFFGSSYDCERFAQAITDFRSGALCADTSGLVPEAAQHFIIMLDLLSQASSHVKLAGHAQARAARPR